ncbi:hypothetical protein [Sphingomonas sp.]|uniref:hypothetical protein n=1 Tax=Sphingomonas sp. TaxID=28214 RepID=UPI0025FECAFD|nr:hypothetical protein [Sphingomonas sp.]MBV9529472.1 hypothetical protein [Sphingomonas sp.]
MNRSLAPIAAGAACAACAALVACGTSGPVAKDAGNTVAVVTNAPAPAANASGGPPQNRSEAQAVPASLPTGDVPALPAALIGRWGLTPGDCTSKRGDAKGLLVIAPRELRFYESRAVPTADVQDDASSASGTFHFTGEGQSWEKYQSLQLQKTLLIRTESNPTASFTYAKCS